MIRKWMMFGVFAAGLVASAAEGPVFFSDFEKGTPPTGWRIFSADKVIPVVSSARAVSGTRSLALVDQDTANYGAWGTDKIQLSDAVRKAGWIKVQAEVLYSVSGQMRMTFVFFDAAGKNAGVKNIIFEGRSEGWEQGSFQHISEKISVPAGVVSVRMSLVSGGAAGVVGEVYLDDLSVSGPVAQVSKTVGTMDEPGLWKPENPVPVRTEGPNVIVIFSDDIGVNDLSSKEHRTAVFTPNLQRLADNGVTFSDAYASASMCTPSRVGMLSGRCPARFGIYDVGGDSSVTWPKDQMIMPQYFKQAGYRTALIGKWHCGGDAEEWAYNHPLERGFDRFWGFMGSTHDYFDARIGSGCNGAGYWGCGYNPIYDQREVVKDITYLTDDINKQALRFIRECGDQPFFLYLAHHALHVPLQVPREKYEEYVPLGYRENTTVARAMIDVMDEGIGRILDELAQRGQLDDTLIIYASDNGGGERSGQVNDIYRGGKFSVMEGGLRVPMLISWPKTLPKGVMYGHPVSNIDFVPTVLAAAGLVPQGELDGVNLLPFLLGENRSAPHSELFWKQPPSMGAYAIRSGNWKLVYSKLGRGLFNLTDDPGETNDLREQYPEVAARLQDAYDRWDQSNIPSRWTPEHHRKYRARRTSDNPLENRIYRYNTTFGE